MRKALKVTIYVQEIERGWLVHARTAPDMPRAERLCHSRADADRIVQTISSSLRGYASEVVYC